MTIWELLTGTGVERVIYIIVGVLTALLVVFLVLLDTRHRGPTLAQVAGSPWRRQGSRPRDAVAQKWARRLAEQGLPRGMAVRHLDAAWLTGEVARVDLLLLSKTQGRLLPQSQNVGFGSRQHTQALAARGHVIEEAPPLAPRLAETGLAETGLHSASLQYQGGPEHFPDMMILQYLVGTPQSDQFALYSLEIDSKLFNQYKEHYRAWVITVHLLRWYRDATWLRTATERLNALKTGDEHAP